MRGGEAGAKPGLFRLQKKYVPTEIVPSSAIYECSQCLGITAFKRGEKFSACHDCPAFVESQGWYHTDDFVHFVSKNLNTEYQKLETVSFRFAQAITDFAGSMFFVLFHLLWFGLWIWMNTGHEVLGVVDFDPYPFPFLVLVVSLEAIFLALFILVAQNIQGRRSDIRSDIDYQVNLKTEKDVAEVLAILNEIRAGRLVIKGKKVVMEDAPPKKKKS